MGFLDKLKLRKKDDDVVPPPPPAPSKLQAQQTPPQPIPEPSPQTPTELPSLDDNPTPTATTPPPATTPLEPLPEDPGVPEESFMAAPDDTATEDASGMDDTFPDQELPTTEDDEEETPLMRSLTGDPSREDVRNQLGDLPPIRVTAGESEKGILTDDHIQDLDVSRFVLPGEDAKQPVSAAPQTPPPSASQPVQSPFSDGPSIDIQADEASIGQHQDKAFRGPMYVDVTTYEDVQKSIDELATQLKQVAEDVDTITKINDKEDKEFSKVVSKLEKIQDKVLQIDEHLFEER